MGYLLNNMDDDWENMKTIDGLFEEKEYSEAKNAYVAEIEKNKLNLHEALIDDNKIADYVSCLKGEISLLEGEIIQNFTICNRNQHLTKEYVDYMVCHDRIMEIKLEGTSKTGDGKGYIDAKQHYLFEIEKIVYNMGGHENDLSQKEIIKLIMQIAELKILLNQQWVII